MVVIKKTRCWSTGLVSALLLMLIVTGAEAQRGLRPAGGGPIGPVTPPAIGARVGLDFDEGAMSVGGQARFMLPFLPGLELMPSADVFFLDEKNEWQLNLDAALQLLPILYGGAGLAVARDSLPTSSGPSIETGYNLFLGLNVPSSRFPIKPFAEARWTIINRFVQPFRIVAGLSVRLGGQPARRR